MSGDLAIPSLPDAWWIGLSYASSASLAPYCAPATAGVPASAQRQKPPTCPDLTSKS